MSTTASIRTWFETRLAAIEGIPDVAVQGTKYTPVAGEPWVRFTLLPAQSVNQSIGVNPVLELNGLAQIDVFYPPLRGVADAETTAQSIVTSFAPAVHLDSGDQIVIENVWVEAIREEPTAVHLPVVVRWKAFNL